MPRALRVCVSGTSRRVGVPRAQLCARRLVLCATYSITTNNASSRNQTTKALSVETAYPVPITTCCKQDIGLRAVGNATKILKPVSEAASRSDRLIDVHMGALVGRLLDLGCVKHAILATSLPRRLPASQGICTALTAVALGRRKGELSLH